MEDNNNQIESSSRDLVQDISQGNRITFSLISKFPPRPADAGSLREGVKTYVNPSIPESRKLIRKDINGKSGIYC